MSRCPDRRSPPLATRVDAVFLSALAAAALLAGGRPVEPAREVVLRSPGAIRRVPFAPGTLSVDGPLGVSLVQLDPGGGVRFTASPCPGKDCLAMGRVRGAGSALACLPNRVVVELAGGSDSGLDGVSR